MDSVEVADIVPVVAVGGRVKGLKPQARYAETREVFEPAVETLEISGAIAVRVHVLLDVETVQDRVLVPEVVNGHVIDLICKLWTARRGVSIPTASVLVRRSQGRSYARMSAKITEENASGSATRCVVLTGGPRPPRITGDSHHRAGGGRESHKR